MQLACITQLQCWAGEKHWKSAFFSQTRNIDWIMTWKKHRKSSSKPSCRRIEKKIELVSWHNEFKTSFSRHENEGYHPFSIFDLLYELKSGTDHLQALVYCQRDRTPKNIEFSEQQNFFTSKIMKNLIFLKKQKILICCDNTKPSLEPQVRAENTLSKCPSSQRLERHNQQKNDNFALCRAHKKAAQNTFLTKNSVAQ